MSLTWNDILWNQFGAAIETLEHIISACPDELWRARLWDEKAVYPQFAEFWYICYHTIFWVDYYTSDSADTFKAPASFTITEPEMDSALPERVYTKPELLTYLAYARNKSQAKIASITNPNELQQVREDWVVPTVAELMLYTMRHIHEHVGQLNMLLGQKGVPAPESVPTVGVA